MASNYQSYLDDTRERLTKSVEHFQTETRGIRTGRANPGLIENLRVEYYGQKTPLNQLATISAPDARSLVVKPFDASALKEIERAVLSSDLGFNPSLEGKMLRISIPPLSQEQRQKLAARVKSLAEEARVSMRNVRRDVIREAEAAAKDRSGDVVLSEDDVRAAKDGIQELLKEYEKRIDALLAVKTDEILKS